MRQAHWVCGAGCLCCGLAVFSPAAGLAHGAVGEQMTRVTPWDARAGAGFGWSIAMGNQVVLVGAPMQGGPPGMGAAYLYNKHTGTAMFQLAAEDATVGDHFGSAVAVDHGTAIIGAIYGGSDQSTLAGAAYLFDIGTGKQLFKLTPSGSEALDRFGSSVAVRADSAVALVGAAAENAAVGVDAGSAYLFDTVTGGQLFRLTASDASAGAGFGTSVAFDADTAVIGASLDPGAGEGAGAAYVFDTVTGSQLRKLTASDGASGANFGRSVAAGNGLAVIGAPTSEAHPGPGAAYVFDLSTGEELFKLTASDSEVGARFGTSVAIGAGLAIVGATLGTAEDESLAGAAYLFDLATGRQLAKLTASDTQAIDYFGGSVTLRGNVAAVGAYGLNTAAGVNAGAAYLFGLPIPIAGDLDGDGFVGIGDLNIVLSAWNETVTPGDLLLGDASGDGLVGIDDLNIVLGAWNTGTPPVSGAPSTVPEPVHLSVLVLMAAIGSRCTARPVR